jgi:hypothetical protein
MIIGQFRRSRITAGRCAYMGEKHSSSLRAIGRYLETIRAEAFTLTHRNGSHIVKSNALTPTCRWIVRSKIVEQAREPTVSARSNLEAARGGYVLTLRLSRVSSIGRKKDDEAVRRPPDK